MPLTCLMKNSLKNVFILLLAFFYQSKINDTIIARVAG